MNDYKKKMSIVVTFDSIWKGGKRKQKTVNRTKKYVQ